MRRRFQAHGNNNSADALSEENTEKHPTDQFKKWYHDVLKANFKEPTAVILATSRRNGKPSVRTVLMKDFSEEGFVFFTNYQSRKGRELKQNPKAAMLFYWDTLMRQVRVEGTVQKVSPDISDKYFDSRPRQSRISAIASPQSAVIESRFDLEKKAARLESKFFGRLKIPRPANWGGYILKPTYFEFWQGRENRLHDRIIYVLAKGKWMIKRLAP